MGRLIYCLVAWRVPDHATTAQLGSACWWCLWPILQSCLSVLCVGNCSTQGNHQAVIGLLIIDQAVFFKPYHMQSHGTHLAVYMSI